jgi:hypothetical protein
MRSATKTWVAAVAALAIVAIAGCRVRVDKDANGREKTVQVDTPFGGVHVNTDQISASDLGLPAYPGAVQSKDNGKEKSADVHMGFGEWQLRVRAVNYETSDSKEQVTAFYKKALGRFGDVITCQDKEPVGTPIVTAEGLNCSDSGGKGEHFKFNNKDYSQSDGFQLKAGSRRHQHIVGFNQPENGKTKFALVALDLPADVDSGSEHSD